MESQGKMLVALSVLAVLTGFSAIGYVAVQQNANVVSKAQTAPSISTTSSTPSTPSSPSTTDNTTGGLTCTTAQDCVEYAIAKGMCIRGAACPPSGSTIECTSGMCVLTKGQTDSPESPRTPEPGKTCSSSSQGDFDCNGVADCTDLMLFIREFSGRASTKTADITKDGKVSLADFEQGRRGSGGAWERCLL